jgi:NAD(P)-dependent dehydrogenase (short-subunit alcohol dehydrogenase family)
MKTEFQDKAALVSGGAMGIGAAVAKLLASRGANVLIADRAEKEGLETAIINSSGGRAEFFKDRCYTQQ